MFTTLFGPMTAPPFLALTQVSGRPVKIEQVADFGFIERVRKEIGPAKVSSLTGTTGYRSLKSV